LTGVVVVIDFCWSAIRTSIANEFSPSLTSCCTVAESKAKGVFLTNVAIEPRSFEWDGTLVSIKESWLEKRSKRAGTYVVVPLILEWPRYETIEGYYVCFNLAQGKELVKLGGPFFVRENKEASFQQTSDLAFSELVVESDLKGFSIFLTNDWRFSKVVKLKVMPALAEGD